MESITAPVPFQRHTHTSTNTSLLLLLSIRPRPYPELSPRQPRQIPAVSAVAARWIVGVALWRVGGMAARGEEEEGSAEKIPSR